MSRLSLTFILFCALLSPSCGFSTTQDGYEDLVCDPSGCFHCSDGTCRQYRCDALNQCPMGRFCSSDNLCLVEENTQQNEISESRSVSTDTPQLRCESHRDCPDGQICLKDGDCVQSPGTPERKETSPDTDEIERAATLDETYAQDDEQVSPALPEHPLAQCVLNAECGQEGRCLDGKCYFPCDFSQVCAPGLSCEDGFCSPAITQEIQCTFHAECGPTLLCIDGLCYDSCEETYDCGAHMKCDTGICVADTSPVIQCAGPSSCMDGHGCVDGKCLSACQHDSDCMAESSCELGFCHPWIDCELNIDCEENAVCLNAQCQ